VKPYERRPTQLPQEPEFLIEFDDGSRWSSVDNMHPSNESDREAVEFAARQSGVPIRWVAASITPSDCPSPLRGNGYGV